MLHQVGIGQSVDGTEADRLHVVIAGAIQSEFAANNEVGETALRTIYASPR